MKNEFIQSVGVERSQTLGMTPQLRQAIALLAMSYDELSQFVSEQVESNPLIELEHDDDRYASIERDGRHDHDDPSYENTWAEDFYDHTGKFNHVRPTATDDTYHPENFLKSEMSLHQKICHTIQIHMKDPTHRPVAERFIEFLDEKGFLSRNLNEISAHLQIPLHTGQMILEQLQKAFGTGLFARSLGECFAIQLKEQGNLTAIDEKFLSHLELITKVSFDQAAKQLGLSVQDIKLSILKVQKLMKVPIESIDTFEQNRPIPAIDLVLNMQHNNQWRLEFNRYAALKLYLAHEVYETLKKNMKNSQDIRFLRTKMAEGKHLMKSIEKRAQSIMSVGNMIVSEQIEFLSGQSTSMKPLKLKDIAEKTGLHESTVSRVTQNKFIQTPKGIFELKDFFSSSLISLHEENSVSSQSIKNQIKDIIKDEHPMRPHSDESISKLLNRQGILIARRTVTKYREALAIPGANVRKKSKAITIDFNEAQ